MKTLTKLEILRREILESLTYGLHLQSNTKEENYWYKKQIKKVKSIKTLKTMQKFEDGNF